MRKPRKPRPATRNDRKADRHKRPQIAVRHVASVEARRPSLTGLALPIIDLRVIVKDSWNNLMAIKEQDPDWYNRASTNSAQQH